MLEGVFGRDVPAERMGQLDNAMHVLYVTSWGAVYGSPRAAGPDRDGRVHVPAGLLQHRRVDRGHRPRGRAGAAGSRSGGCRGAGRASTPPPPTSGWS